jgi:hypothetical protein
MAELCLSGHNPAMSSGSFRRKTKRFSELDGADKWLLLRAAVWLGIARVMLIVMPFQRLAERLSVPAGDPAPLPDEEVLRRIGFAVAAAANNVPWRSDCFPQAIAASRLIRGYGYSSTIHLGVERTGEEGLAGHAWLTCGDSVVTGGADLHRYTEVHRL